LDSIERCDLVPVDFSSLTDIFAGGVSQSFSTDIDGNALSANISVSAPYPISGNPTDIRVSTTGVTSPASIVLINQNGFTNGQVFGVDLTLSNPKILSISADDLLTPSRGTTVSTIGPYAEFEILPSEPISGVTIGYKMYGNGGYNSGVFNFAYCDIDTDFDGISNDLDLDSDNDGIPDAIEACSNINLTLENCNLDADANAIYILDANNCNTGVVSNYCTNAPIDSDNDGTPDYLDLDSDNDGCADAIEVGSNSFYGINGLGFNNPSAPTENCGLIISTQSGVCFIPENNDWTAAATINVCNPICDILNPNADCDEDGVINALDCAIEDNTNTNSVSGNNCNNSSLIFNFGN